jgi:prevent-host-death family protein
MISEIPVTQARDELADLINRVAYGHERIVLTRHSKPVACLVPPEDLQRLEGEGQRESASTSVNQNPASSQRQAAARCPSQPSTSRAGSTDPEAGAGAPATPASAYCLGREGRPQRSAGLRSVGRWISLAGVGRKPQAP